MEIREIIYVSEVAKYKNLTKAAESLHITQPSLSQSIKNVEKQLNITLFVRSKKGMELTESGRRFIDDTNVLIKEYETFMLKASRYGDVKNTLGIGLYKLAHTTAVNDAIMNYISNHSQNNYMIKVESETGLEKMLLDKAIDLAIIKYTPLMKRNSKLLYETLFSEPLYVLMSEKNQLSNEAKLSVRALEGNKLIASDKTEYPYEMIMHMFEQAGVSLEIHTHTNYANMALIMNLVEKDYGITFASRDVCHYYRRKGIKAVPLIEKIMYDVCIVQAKDEYKRGGNLEIIEFIKNYLEEGHFSFALV